MDQQLSEHAARKGKEAVTTWICECNSVGEAVADILDRIGNLDLVRGYTVGGIGEHRL